MSPGQRRRRFGMARDTGILLPGHLGRPHGNTERDEVRVQNCLFRRVRLLLLPIAGHPRRILALCKVVEVHIGRDLEGCRPEQGLVDREGDEVENRTYNVRDFGPRLVIDGRTKVVARKFSHFLKESGDRLQC